MFKNSLKIAWKTLKNRGLNFINLLGLSTEMTWFALFYTMVHTNLIMTVRHQKDAYFPILYLRLLENDLPHIDKVIRFRDWGDKFIMINVIVAVALQRLRTAWTHPIGWLRIE